MYSSKYHRSSMCMRICMEYMIMPQGIFVYNVTHNVIAQTLQHCADPSSLGYWHWSWVSYSCLNYKLTSQHYYALLLHALCSNTKIQANCTKVPHSSASFLPMLLIVHCSQSLQSLPFLINNIVMQYSYEIHRQDATIQRWLHFFYKHAIIAKK